MLTPSAVSTSAEPDCEESARLPCLATGTPQPATTKALAVEMLKLPEASPPVPQVSIVPGGASTATALARMIRAAPAISSTVSPRTLQRHQKGADLRRRRVAAHDDLERRSRPAPRSGSGPGRHGRATVSGRPVSPVIGRRCRDSRSAASCPFHTSPRRRDGNAASGSP